MKYSSAILSLAAVVVAQPVFLNSAYDVAEGQPFTLTFSGCDSGCAITLEHGPSDDLQTYQELTSMFIMSVPISPAICLTISSLGSATGGSFAVTLDNIPSDTYAFKITDSVGDFNYSDSFYVEGTGVEEPTTTATTVEATETATTTATETEETTLTAPESTETPSSTTFTTVGSSSTTATETTTSSATVTGKLNLFGLSRSTR